MATTYAHAPLHNGEQQALTRLGRGERPFSASLHTRARRHRARKEVLSFEGELLLQGRQDSEVPFTAAAAAAAVHAPPHLHASVHAKRVRCDMYPGPVSARTMVRTYIHRAPPPPATENLKKRTGNPNGNTSMTAPNDPTPKHKRSDEPPSLHSSSRLKPANKPGENKHSAGKDIVCAEQPQQKHKTNKRGVWWSVDAQTTSSP